MFIKYFFPISWFVIIVILSLSPSDKIPDFHFFPHDDKVIHFCMYTVFSILLIPALTFKKKYFRSYVLSLAISSITGFTMESCQYLFVIGRTADYLDLAANIFGLITGITIYQLLVRNKKWEKRIFKI